MKKIMFFMFSFSGGGAERTVVNIVNNLSRETYCPILVIGTNKDAPYLDDLSTDVRVINLRAKKLMTSLIPLCKCIKKEKPDVLFSTVNQNNIVLSLAKVLSFKQSQLVIREANNRTQSGNISFFNKFLTFLTYNLISNQVIALSNGVKKDLVENFRIWKSKITVIHNPVEVNKIKKLSHEPVKDFNFDNGQRIIIAVGRLVDQKDYPTLLKAIKKTKGNDQLLILGKGVLEHKLKRMCVELGIENKVSFLGFKKNPYKYIKRSDVFVLSSKWEGFGHVIVEAMATGVPVISTNCNSGPAEIIGDNKYGLIVPTENSCILAENIEKMIYDNKLKDKYAELGLQRAEVFSATSIIKEYEKVFSS
ncbi:glycosyltransferase [Halobacillus sp. A1]|uniref:glycosyltransferase n=1 Tax=Halobacillus sp. A1 TaxID=2880262 RepID=UPI0020A68745|nr:glycosyltransferase [Halobacillus sp. A1]MCP3032936.1 glycosyltransferase [Halobacillus sp. A1]